MGSGYRNFASGEVLTSANVMNYLMDQAVMVFASASARDAALTSPEDGMLVYLQDVDQYASYTTSAWTPLVHAGGWTPYAPAWISTGTSPSIGNGTITGRYMRSGRTVAFTANLVVGTSTGYGSGSYSFSLPAPAVNVGIEQIGHVRVYDASASLAYAGQALIGSGASTCLLQAHSGGALQSITGTIPFTAASGDQFRAMGVYESA